MEQNNSLNSNIQELITVQKEQMRILNEMNNRDSTKSTQTMMNQSAETARVSTANAVEQPIQSGSNPNMYMYASNQMSKEGVPNPQQTANNVFGPPPLMYDERTGQMRKQQFGEYANNMSSGSGNYGFVSSLLPRNSRVSNETRTLTSMDAGYRASQAAVSGLGALGTAGATYAMGGAMTAGVGGFLGSMAITGGIGAAAGMYTDMAIDEIKQQSAYRKYLTQNSYMFINPNESTNDRDIAGFSQSQTKEAANFLRGLSSKTFLKDEEVMTLTQKFTEGGLLKDTKDLETFQKQMTSLTKSVKTGALILNETYESIAEVMSEFKKLGLDQKDFNSTFSGIKVNAANLGIDSSQLTQQVQDYLLNLNFGTGNSNSNTYSRLEDTIVYTTEMYNQLNEKPEYKRTQQEKATYNMIKNLGGADKASEYLNTMQEKMLDKDIIKNQVAGYFFDYDTTKKTWNLNQSRFDEFLSSDKTYQQIANETSRRLGTLSESGHGAAVNEFITNAGTYMRNSMTSGDVAKTLQGTINSLIRDPNYGGNGYDTTKILSDIFDVKDTGAQTLLGSYLDFRVGSGDGLGVAFANQKKWTQVVNESKAETPSIGEWFSSGWDSFKKAITEPFTAMGDDFSDASVRISDWWYRTRNGVDKPDLAENFEIKSLKYGSSTQGVLKDQKDALESIGGLEESLKRLESKGFSVDQSIKEIATNANEAFKRTSIQERERISNWDDVTESVSGRKDDITSASAKTGMSEAMLSALVKYDQIKGTDNVTGDKLESAARSLAEAMDKYKGNQTLGLLSSYGGVDVDKILKEQLKIDVNSNMSAEEIEKLKNIKLDDIEISEESKKLIRELLNVDISKGGDDNNNTGNNTTGPNLSVDYSATGTTQKNEELIKLASEKYGFSEATFAALLATENESGTNHGVNGAGARGAAQLTTSVSGWAGIATDLKTGEVWNGSMATVTGEENNSMNISVGAAHFDSYLKHGKDNVWIGYGMYNGGPTGFGNVLRAGGFAEEDWENLSADQIIEMLQRTVPGTEYEKAMKRYKNQMIKVTGDENIGSKSGREIHDGVNNNQEGETGTDDKGEYIVNHGVKTYKETKILDNSLTPEELLKQEEHKKVLGASSISEKRFDFLNTIDGVVNTSDSDYEDMLTGVGKKDAYAKGAALYAKNLVEKGYSYEEIMQDKGYKNYKISSMSAGAGEDSIKEIEGIISAWTKLGGSAYDESKEYDSPERKEQVKKRYEKGAARRDHYVLEKFGNSLGIDLSDFDGDVDKYNSAINETSRMFVGSGMTQINEYLNYKNGGEETDAAKSFNNMSAVDKIALVSSLDAVNGALGKGITGYDDISEIIGRLTPEELKKRKEEKVTSNEDRIKEIDKELKTIQGGMDRGLGQEDKINQLYRERGELTKSLENDGKEIEEQIKTNAVGDAILSDKDKEVMQYLHKDEKGKIYYDGSKKSEQEMGVTELIKWQKDGSKEINYSKARGALESKHGVKLGALNFDEAMEKAKEMYNQISFERMEVNKEASEIISGVSNTFIQGKLSGFLQNQDLEGLGTFTQQLREGKIKDADGNVVSIEGSEDAISKLSDALKKLSDSADVKDIMNLINGLQDLKDSIADVATATRMTELGLDEGSKHQANTGIANDTRELFRSLSNREKEKGNTNNDFEKMLKAMEHMTPENIKEAILQGLESGDGIKINNKSFALDSDTLLELSTIVSENTDEAIKAALKNDKNYGDGEGSIDGLVSGKEKEIAKAMGMSIDELKQSLGRVAELNEDLAKRQDTQTEEYKKLEDERNTTVEQIFEGYSETMKDYKDSAETATETFATSMEKYDKALADAIAVLEERVNRKGFLSGGIVEVVTGILGGGSNTDNTTRPSEGRTARR